MAKRYRYAFAKKREAQQGKLSAVLAAVSLVLFVTAVLLAFFLQGQYGYIVGGISLCAMLLSVYGFAMGLKSFSEENRTHKAGMIGSIANGIIMIGWLGIFLMGISGLLTGKSDRKRRNIVWTNGLWNGMNWRKKESLRYRTRKWQKNRTAIFLQKKQCFYSR